MRARILGFCIAILVACVPPAWAEGASDPAAARLYIKGAFQSYRHAYDGALTLQRSVLALLASPDERSLAQARQQWELARAAFEMTRPFSLSGSPGEAVEADINEWITSEALAARLADTKTPLTAQYLRESNARKQPLTGWYAVAYMLWGEKGARPASDFIPGTVASEQLRAYLQLLIGLLVEDVAFVTNEWTPGGNYGAALAARPPGDMLTAALEQLGALCRVASAEGAEPRTMTWHRVALTNVYFGTYPAIPPGEGLSAVVAARDPALDQHIRTWIAAMRNSDDPVMLARSFADLATLLADARKAVAPL